ncbi:MAG: HupE/UreJ family protein [Hyphomonadaceae bacterium]|nr:HupE/UreJ family protein [Hyphomonadaceae bacterium]MBC6411463.1 HupE/UreJ family protein [Hyphomonadaceae bacterium]
MATFRKSVNLFPRVGIAVIFIVISLSGIFGKAYAHPEDDLCEPGMDIGQELCRELSELNSSEADLFHPLKDEAGNIRSPLGSARFFLEIGVRHILPGGLDHILFVLALFLAAAGLRSLVLQISVFTVAHTVTLGLTAARVIEPPPAIVEPLIALSIAVVALETLFRAEQERWKFLIIFGFGLFHGMGFAGFVREIGLPPEQFWPSLIGFNIGVEIGQLSVVLAAALLCRPVRQALAQTNIPYRTAVVVPASLAIAMTGLWWFVTRSLGL